MNESRAGETIFLCGDRWRLCGMRAL